MTTSRVSKSAQIRASLGHSIIDSDGHIIENPSVVADYIKAEVWLQYREAIRSLEGVPAKTRTPVVDRLRASGAPGESTQDPQ
jgi:hypothetical protein